MVELIGIDANWREDALFGVVVGAMFIVANLITPAITLGVPVVLEKQSEILIKVFGAPIVEEVFFRVAILSLLWLILSKVVPGTFALIGAILGQAALFAIFHVNSYGISNEAALYGALVFGIVAGVITFLRRSVGSSIVAHTIFNGWIITKAMVVISR